jgi:hypothetical protein
MVHLNFFTTRICGSVALQGQKNEKNTPSPRKTAAKFTPGKRKQTRYIPKRPEKHRCKVDTKSMNCRGAYSPSFKRSFARLGRQATPSAPATTSQELTAKSE